jgi:hypothetical protein
MLMRDKRDALRLVSASSSWGSVTRWSSKKSERRGEKNGKWTSFLLVASVVFAVTVFKTFQTLKRSFPTTMVTTAAAPGTPQKQTQKQNDSNSNSA